MEMYLLNLAGLIFDIIGVLGLFRYGLPSDLNKQGHVFYVHEKKNQEQIDKYKVYERNSKISLVLIVIGFLLQLTSNIIGLTTY